ncbi:MAG: MoaD/ThiS family protein [Oscillospiraceae bacterium]|nr:MoaD/ThiS family protein [Oscillospiraceae bacterium]
MIEVRLFAGLRQGRQKIYQMEPDSIHTVQDIMDTLDIQRSEVNILLINGFHQKPETTVKDEDIVSLFPAVGGG